MNLEQQVKHLDKHYRDGNALVSDKEFDKLEKQLLKINLFNDRHDYIYEKVEKKN